MSAPDRLRWRWIAAIAALGTLLHAQAVLVGFAGDDYVHLAMLDGVYPGDRSVLELFTFFRNDPGELREHVSFGTAPWWTVPGFFGAVLRPLASLLIAFDGAVFAKQAGPQHAHTLLWWMGTLIAAGALLRRLLPASVCAVALVLFAVDDAATVPMVWLANRAVLVSALFCFVALWAHVRWRTEAWRRGPWIETGAWILAFGGGEYAISGAAFVLAYELVHHRKEGLAGLLRGLLPAAGTLLVYVTLHRALGFGTIGSAVYVDPFSEPAAYVGWAVNRIPRLWAELMVGLPSNLGELSWRVGFGWAWWLEEGAPIDQLMRAAFVLGLLASLAACIPLWLARRSMSEAQRQTASWLLLGALLGLIPVAAAPSHGRLLLICNLGASAGVAWVMVAAVRGIRERAGARAWTLGGLAGVLAIPHFLLEPRSVLLEEATFRYAHAQITAALQAPDLAAVDLAGKRVILAVATEPTTGIHGHLVLHANGRPLPESWQVLSMTIKPHALQRVDERALVLSSIEGPMLQEPPERFFRPAERPLAAGDVLEAGGMKATVLSVRNGGPDRVRFDFDRDLDDDVFVLLRADAEGLHPIPMPAVGKAVAIAPPRVPGMAQPILRGR